ncbi:group I intron-associated PD-(D/E)XK endonuclease [Phytoactinopolyspora endophytica]|uniref:group I intron-associated PD-(D/E)XK endonuclease n=1 Tax=Phytoactinopolyspora endophytica TaxID=1642495 RepID=UPI00101DA397|nr:group I intron-associated PD-(D/E)XK endonuclease [Phytoactinopolyspora endophytica]
MEPTNRNIRSWTDEQLREAVASAANWGEVARTLGLASSSTGAIRRHTRRMGLDTSHFRGKRQWSDRDLQRAMAEAASWADVLRRLGVSDTSEARTRVKGQATRLGLDLSHLSVRQGDSIDLAGMLSEPVDLLRLRAAAEPIAIAWFAVRGMPVAIPAEACEYDLLVTFPDGIKRVQVKSTTQRSSNGRWQVGIGRRPYSLDKTARKAPYDPELLDYFLVINGAGEIYLIPSVVVAGRLGIVVDNYPEYKVGTAASLFAQAA